MEVQITFRVDGGGMRRLSKYINFLPGDGVIIGRRFFYYSFWSGAEWVFDMGCRKVIFTGDDVVLLDSWECLNVFGGKLFAFGNFVCNLCMEDILYL